MKYNKIYIATPDHCEAGGVESLYQLADAINSVGGTAITLFDNPHDNPIPAKYNHYNIKYDSKVDDNDLNLIIFPEVWTERLGMFGRIRKAIWWLSVDNNHNKFTSFDSLDVMHYYQSYYALAHLLNNQAAYYLPLFDYINNTYTTQIVSLENKQDIVCYNPVKGFEITNRIIEASPEISFVPLINMNEQQVIETLKTSKVYIDFGTHPGRDRIPREAAILYNCVITGFEGSACFYNDVCIDTKYKFANVDNISEILHTCFNNFTTQVEDFHLYRTVIKQQKEQLFNLVKQYFL